MRYALFGNAVRNRWLGSMNQGLEPLDAVMVDRAERILEIVATRDSVLTRNARP
jgi:hypothetical protein